jgi:hypothetical protein
MKASVHILEPRRDELEFGPRTALCGAQSWFLLREKRGEPATCKSCIAERKKRRAK